MEQKSFDDADSQRNKNIGVFDIILNIFPWINRKTS